MGTDAAASARDLLEQLTGSTPTGEWSAPGRVNLIGEHTDYNDGFVLPFAIDKRTHAAVRLRDDAVLRVASTFDDSEPVTASIADLDARYAGREGAPSEDWADYPLGVAWALVRTAGVDAGSVRGADIALASDVPVGAGLSSSAAIEGAVAGALNDLWDLELPPVMLARVGKLAENEAVGAPTGIMDQMASVLGEQDCAIFLDCRTLETSVVSLQLAPEGLSILVMDTGVKHAHATGGYGERRAACERGASVMGVRALRDLGIEDLPRAQELLDDVTFRRVRHVVTEDDRVLETVRVLAASGPRAIGDLLLASHASMRDDFEISVPELDAAVDAAQAGGAIGSRMTGGGFGGAAIALVPDELVEDVKASVSARFAERGFKAPRQFVVHPAQGARRDR